MSTFVNNDVSPAAVVRATDHNTQGALLAAVLNGGIEDANVSPTAAIAGSKLADASIANGKITDHTIQPVKLTGVDGYIVAEDTWVYVSATSFKITGVDRTALFPVGAKLKLTQTTAKYFYVTASAFSTDTTVTVTGGTDYTLANASITSPYYSYAAAPQGFPQWFVYAPTFANMTLGSATVTGKFAMIGKTVKFRAQFTLGAGSAIGSAPTVTLPVTSPTLTVNSPVGTVIVQDTGTAQYGGWLLWTTTTTAILVVGVASGSYTSVSGLATNVPIAVPASTDFLAVEGSYEAA